MASSSPTATTTTATTSRYDAILAEFIESERHYVRDLTTLLEVYLPLPPTHLTEQQTMILRSNVPQILELHTEILAAFINTTRPSMMMSVEPYLPRYTVKGTIVQRRSRRSIRMVDMNNIPGTLIRFADQLSLVYETYVSTYDQVMEVYDRIVQSQRKVREHLDGQRRRVPRCHGLAITGFTIMPIQRLPRYELLLLDLRKQLSSCTEAERAVLPEALGVLHTITLNINDRKRELEYEQRVGRVLQTVVAQLPPDRPQPSVDIYNGLVWLWSSLSKHKRTLKLHDVHLYDGLLIWARDKQSQQQQQQQQSTAPVAIDDGRFMDLTGNTIKVQLLLNSMPEGYSFAKHDVASEVVAPGSLPVIRDDDDLTTRYVKQRQHLQQLKMDQLAHAITIDSDGGCSVMVCSVNEDEARLWYTYIQEAVGNGASGGGGDGGGSCYPLLVLLGRGRRVCCHVSVSDDGLFLLLRHNNAMYQAPIPLNEVMEVRALDDPPIGIMIDWTKRPLVLVAPNVKVRNAWVKRLTTVLKKLGAGGGGGGGSGGKKCLIM